MAAEAGSGGPGRPGPRGGGPRARALWPPAVLRRSRLRSRLRRRKDGWHGGPGERALYPLRSRQLPAGRGEVRGGEPWEAPRSLFTSLPAGFPFRGCSQEAGRWRPPPPLRAPFLPSSVVLTFVLYPGSLKRRQGDFS